jgi:DNA transposition AAA+ family ATPase
MRAFVETKEYRRFEEFCEACRRERYIGLCYGPPGVGKTLSARHYAKWHLFDRRVPYWRPDYKAPAEAAACHTAFYTPPVTNTPRAIEAGLEYARLALVQIGGLADPDDEDETDGFLGRCQLIIVDEADRLKTPSLEELRDRYDRGDFGLVLLGMPGLEKRLARYPQLYSRVGFAHAFRPLSAEEVRFILEKHWAALGLTMDEAAYTDAVAVAAIIRITSGNFRLLDRLLGQVRRILQVNGLRHVTKEVVETARECLVIGSV